MRSILKAAAMAAMLASAATAAEARTFEFSYQFDGGVLLTGLMEGTLQGDGNTILLSSIPTWNLGGAAGPALTFMTNYDALGAAIGLASLDGSILEFLACENSACLVGIGADSDGSALGTPYFVSGFDSALVADPSYSNSGWQVSAVPLPATLLLLGAAVGLLGVARLRPATT